MAEMQQLPHKLTLDERKKLGVTGVAEVVSFDEGTVVLRTGLGTLIVQGQGLQLKQLSPEGGSVTVEGQIASLVYEQTREARGLLGRLFG